MGLTESHNLHVPFLLIVILTLTRSHFHHVYVAHVVAILVECHGRAV